MYPLYHALRATARFLVAASAGSLIQYMSEVTDIEKPDHITWLVFAAVGFTLGALAFIAEGRARPADRVRLGEPPALTRLKGHSRRPRHASRVPG